MSGGRARQGLPCIDFVPRDIWLRLFPLEIPENRPVNDDEIREVLRARPLEDYVEEQP